eukprot:4864954-Pleurochrysis_carterae.AAC.1
MGHGSSEAEEQYETQYTVAAPLFQTPPPSIIGATAPARTRSRDEIAPMASLDSTMPNSAATNVPLPKPWCAIVGGPFAGFESAITTMRYAAKWKATQIAARTVSTPE